MDRPRKRKSTDEDDDEDDTDLVDLHDLHKTIYSAEPTEVKKRKILKKRKRRELLSPDETVDVFTVKESPNRVKHFPKKELPQDCPFIHLKTLFKDEEGQFVLESAGARAIAAKPTPATDALTLSGPSGVFKRKGKSEAEDKAVKFAANVLFFRFHDNNGQSMKDQLMPPDLPVNTPSYQHSASKLRKYFSDLQSKTLLVYLDGMQGLIYQTGGMKKWQQSTVDERFAVYKHFWRKDPLAMAIRVNPVVCHSVDLQWIFRSKTPVANSWRDWLLTKFAWICDDVFITRLVKQDENTHFSNFRVIPARKKIVDGFKELGGVEDVPVVATGVVGGKAENEMVGVSEGLENEVEGE